MLAAMREWRDQLLGRGSAAITVPVMDGALKPNRALDEAAVVAELPGLDDRRGQCRYASTPAPAPRCGAWTDDAPSELRRFDAAITAIALVGARPASPWRSPASAVLVLAGRRRRAARLDTLAPSACTRQRARLRRRGRPARQRRDRCATRRRSGATT
jgi:hypothetical protein